MSRKLFFIIILLLVAIIGIAAWYFFLGGQLKVAEIYPGNKDGGGLFPFGDPKTQSTTTGSATPDPETKLPPATPEERSDILSRLRKISKEPVAGSTFVRVGSTTLVRYVDRATGHIYDSQTASKSEAKISNMTIPKINEVVWSADGGRVVFRYLEDGTDTIKSFYVKIGTTTKPDQAIEGSFLADNIREIHALGNKLFYLSESQNGSQGVIMNFDGTGKVNGLASPFGDWSYSLSGPKIAFIYPRPSGTSGGYGYLWDIEKGTQTKVANDYKGLEGVVSPAGDYVLMSASDGSSMATAIYSSADKTISVLPIRTLAGKCAWNPSEKTAVYCAVPLFVDAGIYPDNWYMGLVGFSDAIWRMDAKTGESSMILDTSFDTSIQMDMTDIKFDPSGTFLTFKNKTDQSLWLYKIKL